MKIIIKWKKDNVKIIPTKTKGNIMLLPGFNSVDSETWALIKKEFTLESRHEWQYIEEVIEKVNIEGKEKSVKSVAEFTPSFVKEVVKDCVNVNSLTDIITEVKDADVRYTVEKRKDEILEDKATLSKKLGAKKN